MTKERLAEIPIRFYRTAAGREPVLEWLRGLDREDHRAIGHDLQRVQFGWPIGMPLVRSLKDGLWELRSTLPSRRIARLILCF
jgi:phage-related protein